MVSDTTAALDKCDIPFEIHIFNVLHKYDSKCTTSLHHFLKFCSDQRAILALGRHDYVKLNVMYIEHV